MQVWSKHESNLYNTLFNESIENHRIGVDGFGKTLSKRPKTEVLSKMPMNLKGTSQAIVITDLKFIEDVMEKADSLPPDTTHEKLLETIMDLKELEQVSIFDEMQAASRNVLCRKSFDVKPLISELSERTKDTC